MIKEVKCVHKKGTKNKNQQYNMSVMCPKKFLSGHWNTIVRPQYATTCGISSVVSVWNYQFSTLGIGKKEPISVQQALLILNVIGQGSTGEQVYKKLKKQQLQSDKLSISEYLFKIPFKNIAGNSAIMQWYQGLCRAFDVQGKPYMFYKANTKKSMYNEETRARKALVEGLSTNGKICFVYHCHNHYFCPIGYQFIGKDKEGCCSKFSSQLLLDTDNQLNILVGDSSKPYTTIHTFNWKLIETDLTTFYPYEFVIRQPNQGVKLKEGADLQKKGNKNIYCLMAFQKISD